MEATAVSVGKSVLGGALSYAQTAIAEEGALKLGVQRDQSFIRDELEMMQSFLLAADKEHDGHHHEVIRTWVKQVRDVAYDVEDCLQDYAARLKKPPWWSLPCTVHRERRRIGNEMKELRAKVEDVSQRNMRYHGVSAAAPQSSSVTAAELLQSTAAIDDIDEARRAAKQQEKVDLVKLITNDGQGGLRVIAVLETRSGPAGTVPVVRAAYQKLKGEFECHAWVRLMHSFDANQFIGSLVRQFKANSREGTGKTPQGTPSGVSVLNEMEAQDYNLLHDFTGYVTNKKYLVVLNGLSTIEEWDWIKTYLPNNHNGSRVLVCTQQAEVASCCTCTDDKYKVSEIQHEGSFSKPLYVFYKEVVSQPVNSDSTKMKSETRSSMEGASTTSDSKTVPSDGVIQEDGPKDLPESSLPPHLNRDSNTVSVKELSRSTTQLIGRGKEKDDVIKLLSDCNPIRQVISVWGMGGIGKTTLVKSIYQSSELEKLGFERRAWVTVLRPFQLTELLRSLAQRLVKDSPGKKVESIPGLARSGLSTMGSEELIDKLKQDLTGKKYLIVLDDLSTTTEWDSIIRNLPINNNGSRIILTTRFKLVAQHCSKKEMNMHNIEGLTDGDALELFLTKVRMDGDESELKPDLKEEAKIIIKKCGRLPLAVATVGGFLSARPRNIIEWREFSDRISEEFDNNPSLEMIKKILASSYEGLTYHLKSCFLYMSIFPEDSDIRYRRLLRRWTAEGYSRATRNRSNEKVAEEQFTALLNKSMIQQSKTIASGKTGFCQVYNLMHEIIISKSEEENLVLVLDDHITSRSKDKVRHLVVSKSWSREKNDMQNIVDVSHIRSLTVFGEWKSFFLSKKMRMLRVLDLEDAEGLQDPDLVPIGKLHHLKYLSLRGSFGVFNLPNSFGNLLNLETLDIRGTWVTKLPATIGRLQNLKYVHAGSLDDEDDQPIIKLLHQFRSIREEMGTRFAVSYIMLFITAWLRNLDVCGVKVPRGIGRLRSIHTLSIVNIARGKALLKNLKKLTQLCKLGVTGINKNNCKELCSAIADHGRLQSLLLRAEGNAGLEGCLDNMSQPPKDLKSLQLYGNLVTLPEWIKDLKILQKLSLRNTNLKADTTMEVLGNLPMLAILRLQDNACEEEESVSVPSVSQV
ncbi:hypothetical protein OsJ_28116 [Oryza sativa Japonica Group]|uniref:Uncharacterized protein n=1 Tax=Oryza sativa subsp. japonica TaxID=39947 RepID=A3BVB1_ORYSJ|nr:hypothetical protein OsJ_28116 [Oryza sativa Japonica Group]